MNPFETTVVISGYVNKVELNLDNRVKHTLLLKKKKFALNKIQSNKY